MKRRASRKCAESAYHVDHNESLDRWDIVDSEGRVIGHCHDQSVAIGLAISEAQHAHSRGEDIVICVEQPDGHYTMAWASH